MLRRRTFTGTVLLFARARDAGLEPRQRAPAAAIGQTIGDGWAASDWIRSRPNPIAGLGRLPTPTPEGTRVLRHGGGMAGCDLLRLRRCISKIPQKRLARAALVLPSNPQPAAQRRRLPAAQPAGPAPAGEARPGPPGAAPPAPSPSPAARGAAGKWGRSTSEMGWTTHVGAEKNTQ